MTESLSTNKASKGKAGLFVTCAVDMFRPAVGFATATLIEACGYEVVVPDQGCCGQVAYNNGLPEESKTLAWTVVAAFAGLDWIVVPSGSCAAMLNVHYPRLFDGDPRLPLVQEFADKVLELTCFLERFLPENYHIDNTGDMPFQPVAYHHSCSGLRELGIKQQPKTLLERCCNLTPLEVTDADVCCGFGGTFCVKFAEISNRLVSEKCANITAASNMLSGGDLPCLLHIVGKSLHGGQAAIKARHIAELLAGDYRSPAIGEGDG